MQSDQLQTHLSCLHSMSEHRPHDIKTEHAPTSPSQEEFAISPPRKGHGRIIREVIITSKAVREAQAQPGNKTGRRACAEKPRGSAYTHCVVESVLSSARCAMPNAEVARLHRPARVKEGCSAISSCLDWVRRWWWLCGRGRDVGY